MFLGEVVGKRVVVQGLWIGGWCWGDEPPLGRDEGIRGGWGNLGIGLDEANRAWGR